MNPEPEITPNEAAPDEEPLSQQQREQLQEAGERLSGILSAARVASFTGWTVGAFGALSLLLGFMSLKGAAVGVGLLAVAWNEFRGRRMLRVLDPDGARVLGWNQLALLAVVAVYCGWSVWVMRYQPTAELQQLEELAELPEGFVSGLATAVYGAVLLLVAVVQALLARYHFARGPRLREYLDETPRWIVDVQRAAP